MFVAQSFVGLVHTGVDIVGVTVGTIVGVVVGDGVTVVLGI